jgi:hypothetical protein
MDRDASDVPEVTDAVVSQSAHGLAVKVLHAQDVDLRGFESDEVIPQPRFKLMSSSVTVHAAVCSSAA